MYRACYYAMYYRLIMVVIKKFLFYISCCCCYYCFNFCLVHFAAWYLSVSQGILFSVFSVLVHRPCTVVVVVLMLDLCRVLCLSCCKQFVACRAVVEKLLAALCKWIAAAADELLRRFIEWVVKCSKKRKSQKTFSQSGTSGWSRTGFCICNELCKKQYIYMYIIYK